MGPSSSQPSPLAVPVLGSELSHCQLVGGVFLAVGLLSAPASFSFLTRVVWMSDRRAVSFLKALRAFQTRPSLSWAADIGLAPVHSRKYVLSSPTMGLPYSHLGF